MENVKKSVLWMLQSALQQGMDQHFSHTNDELVIDWGAVGGVRVFFEVGCEKMAGGALKLRNYFVSKGFFRILVKTDGKDAMKIEKLEN